MWRSVPALPLCSAWILSLLHFVRVFLWGEKKINSACVSKCMGRKLMDLPIETLPFLSLGLSLCQVLSMCGACQGREELFPKYRTWISWSLIGGSNLHYLTFHDLLCSFLFPFLCLLLVSSSSRVQGWSPGLMSFQPYAFPMNPFKLTLPSSAHTKVSWESPQLLWFTLTRSSALQCSSKHVSYDFFFSLCCPKVSLNLVYVRPLQGWLSQDCSSSCFQLICSQSTWKSVLF